MRVEGEGVTFIPPSVSIGSLKMRVEGEGVTFIPPSVSIGSHGVFVSN